MPSRKNWSKEVREVQKNKGLDVSTKKKPYKELESHAADLQRRLDEERQIPRITPQLEKDLISLRTEIEVNRTEINALALWLRENKPTEIARGDHNGRTLSNVLIGYLARTIKKEDVQ